MGVVQRQGTWNTLISYAGMAISMANAILLYPKILEGDELGLVKLLPYIALIYVQVATMGIQAASLHYFPYVDDKKRGHHGYLRLLFTIALGAFILATGIYFLLKPIAVETFSERSALFIDYYAWTVPLALFGTMVVVLVTYASVLLKTVIASLVQQLLIPFFNLVSILCLMVGWVDFDGFLMLFIGLNSIAALVLVIYLIRAGQWTLAPWRTRFRTRRIFKPMLNKGVWTMLNGLGIFVYQLVDSLMITAMIGLGAVGVYATMIPILQFLMAPARSMYKIIAPLIGQHINRSEWGEIKEKYRQAGIVGFTLGGFLFILACTNLDLLFSDILLGESFSDGKWVIYFIGISRLVTLILAGSLGGTILVTSQYYKMINWFMFIAIILAIVLNLILIPKYHLAGAALATTICAIIVNLLVAAYIKFRFNIWPITWQSLLMALIVILFVFIGIFLPHWGHWVFDAIIRSILLSVTFWFVALKSKLSPDLNNFFKTFLIKAGLSSFARLIP